MSSRRSIRSIPTLPPVPPVAPVFSTADAQDTQDTLDVHHFDEGMLHWEPQTRTVVFTHTHRSRRQSVRWTITEYRLFVLLADGLPTTYDEFANELYQSASDPAIRAALDKHIDRMRRKLRGTGLTIRTILTYGYLLMDEQRDESEDQRSTKRSHRHSGTPATP